MIWLGIANNEDGRFCKSGLAPNTSDTAIGPMLERGTLMFETTVAGHHKPHDLLGVCHPFPWPRELSFRAIPRGGIALLHRSGNDITHSAIRWPDDGRTNSLRVTYAWDAPQGWGRLSLERPEGNHIISRPVHMPRPFMTDDLRDVFLAHPARTLASEVQFAAVSSDISPLGPLPSLHPSTPVLTPSGYKPIEHLKRGDTVFAASGELVPVLHVVRQRVPARGSFAPIRLRAPYLKLEKDILVAPAQRLVLRGAEVEYLFGRQAVLVPARHLVNGQMAVWCKAQSTVEYMQVILPGHEAIMSAGCALESMYIGRIRRNADRLNASVLADIPSRLLPEHARPIHQVVGQFEAITLVAQRAA